MTTLAHSPAVTRALADIEEAKASISPQVAECLDFIGDLIKENGDPGGTFDRVLDICARERLIALVCEHRIRLVQADGDNSDAIEALGDHAHLVGDILLVPPGQRPSDTLDDLRAALAEAEK
ncbi:hypothetical protein ACWCP6_17915 [Streptomyces sp. NPDC002004]